MPRTVRIDIVSDIACPWCAIGYARLQKALAKLPELSAEIHWRAFELNPDPNLVPEPILPALCRKYGTSAEQMQANQQHLMAIAAQLGVDFSGMEQRYTCNTFNAHRLVKWAATENRQTEMKLALFDAYFGRAESVSETQVLCACAEQAGLSPAVAAQVLNSDAFAAEVRQEQLHYRQAGIQSVPAFIIEQKYLISGAQEPAVLANSLQQILSELDK